MTNEKQNFGYIGVTYLTKLIDCPFPDELVMLFQTDRFPDGILVRGYDTAPELSTRLKIIHPMATQLRQLARIEFSSTRSIEEITEECARHFEGLPHIKDSPYRGVPYDPRVEVEKFGAVVFPYSRVQENEDMVSHALENKLREIGEVKTARHFEVKVRNYRFVRDNASSD